MTENANRVLVELTSEEIDQVSGGLVPISPPADTDVSLLVSLL
jgi:hypothetical protein